jgi:urease accessory protein
MGCTRPAPGDVTLGALQREQAAMLTVNKLIPQGRGLAKALLQRATQVELDWDVRQKSRFDATDSAGRQLGVFLPRGAVVRGGDVLVAEDGSLIAVAATAQPVLVVRHCTEHGTPFDLLRAAYHLGNRHVALELQPECLLLEPDPVLADMLRRMHLIVTETSAPFEPEAGAYQSTAGARGHGSGHAHGHGHAHEAPHDHDHDHDQDAGHGHQHGHGHDDDQGHSHRQR